MGVDENGLGARLGPLLVTGVLARVEAHGERTLARLPAAVRADLGDSKALVAHGDVALGEAWARVVAGRDVATPEELGGRLFRASRRELRALCPSHVEAQCWSPAGETFHAPDELVTRVAGHVATLGEKGLTLTAARAEVLCTARLNAERRAGNHRFLADLHGMERVVLALREIAGAEVRAVCGKVGGLTTYPPAFGPLAGRLHLTLEEDRARSHYRLPGLGELAFARDADAQDPLVMLASLIGKYLRELLMARIARTYAAGGAGLDPSGYHDPVTTRWIASTADLRSARRVPDDCFERERAGQKRGLGGAPDDADAGDVG